MTARVRSRAAGPAPGRAAAPARPRLETGPLLALAAAARELGRQEGPAGVIRELPRQARLVTGADHAGVLVRASHGREFEIAAGEEGEGELPEGLRIGSLPGRPLQAALRSRAAIWADLPGEDLEAASCLGLLPILAEGTVLGVLAVAWRGGQVEEGERALAAALVAQAGTAVELAALRGELEHGLLREELTARAEGAEALHRVAAEVAGRRDPAGIAEDAVRALMELCGAAAGAFYLVDEDGAAQGLVHVGLTPDRIEHLEAGYAGGGRQLFAGTRSQVLVTSEERRRAIRQSLERDGIGCVVRVPAVARSRAVAALILYHARPRTYGLHELALLEAFAVQLAGGLRLAQAYLALEQADRDREEFLALISHDLRHPVAAIATLAETLADTPGLGPAEARALASLRGQARGLARMAEEILETARMESGAHRPPASRLDLAELCAGVLGEAPEPARVQAALPSVPVPVRGDARLLGRALDNLIRNALKYSAVPDPVEVSLAATATEAVVEVRDTGAGLTAADLSRLFTKYGRAVNRRTSEVEGIGLGLYLTRLVAEVHGGSVSASSAGPGRGSTFTLRLPLDL